MKSIDPDFEELSNEQLAKIDSICSEYETQRKQGGQVSIEALLSESTPDIRLSLERELIQIELEILEGWDQLSSVQTLEDRFPDYREFIHRHWSELRRRTEPATSDHPRSVRGTEANSMVSTFEEGRDFKLGTKTIESNAHSEVSAARFRIVRNLAEGGIGTVFVAFDEDLKREVAIKELKKKFANDESIVNRFELEASVTGNLEHPNIVPIYARGKRTDGRPYYAMRLVRGKSMAAVISDLHKVHPVTSDLHQNVALRDLLFRFVTVCRAVGFAHSRGILHRDLKPSNVMIGDYGETLVVDWGLARLMNQATSQTRQAVSTDDNVIQHRSDTLAGTVVGTPGFMSPEQALGHTEHLTVTSDIYSLGATLFQILTNQIPYRHTGMTRQVGKANTKVANQEDLAPPETNVCVDSQKTAGNRFPFGLIRHLPPALQAICIHALEYEPHQRYKNAENLANDLEAWLLGDPVSVLPENYVQKTKRWARRNPAKVTAGLVGVLVSLVAMGITLSILSIKNESLRQSFQRERNAAQAAAQLATVAKESGNEAVRQRERVLAILKTFLFDVEKGLTDIPGSATVQKNVLTTVLQQLGEISGDFSDDKRASQDNVMALVELGDLFSRVDTKDIELNLPNWEKNKLSPLEAASAMYTEALKIQTEIGDHDPKLSRRMIAMIQAKQADVKVQTADTAEALRLFEMALQTQKAILIEAPDSIQANLDAVVTADGLGKIWLASEDLPRAQKHYEEMLLSLDALHEKNPKLEEVQRSLGLAHSRLGDVYAKSGDLELAAKHYDADLEISKTLFELHPNDLSSKRDICIAYDRSGNMATRRGKIDDALKSYMQALTLRREIIDAEPSSMRAKRELFISHMKCGDTRMLLRDLVNAKEDYAKAMVIADEMATIDPNNASASQFQSLSAEVLADVAIEEGKFADALRFAEKSVEISERLLAKDPADGQKQSDLTICKLKVAKVLYSMENYDSCLAKLAEVLPIVRSQFEKQPGTLQSAREYSIVLLRIAEAQIASKKLSEAEQNCHEALHVLQSVPEQNRQDAVSKRRLVNTWTMLGQTQHQQEKHTEARESWEVARKLASAMISDNMRVEQMRADLAEIENLLESLGAPKD